MLLPSALHIKTDQISKVNTSRDICSENNKRTEMFHPMNVVE